MSDAKRIIVAIDGPSGAGKSTLAQRVADRLGFLYINTGAMYRALALWSIRLQVAASDMHRLEQLANEVEIELENGSARVKLNGEDVTSELADAAVSAAASHISTVPAVRRALVARQRDMAEEASVVMEGRDVGTVIFPEAQIKIFLDADPEERARRRAEQHGRQLELSTVADEITERDQRDRERAEAPLVQAPDAHLLDTTGLSIEEVEEVILGLVRARTSNGKEAAR